MLVKKVGRNKEYLRDDVLDKAMRLFWLHGYDAVSTQMLVEGMGINRKSVYAEFGNKQKLYHTALERYLREEVPQRFTALNTQDGGLQAVFDVLDRFANAVDREGSERGCMLCNAASETAHLDPTVRRLVNDYFAVINSAFFNALSTAVRNGELSSDFEPENWSASLATTVVGMFVMIRSCVDGAILKAAADLAIAQLASHQKDS